MVIDNSSIANFLVKFIKTIIDAVIYLWDFLTSPIFEFEIKKDSLLAYIVDFISGGLLEPGIYSISFLWFFTGFAIVFLIVLKIVTLVNPLG